ncbi:MAG: sterol desaturase family protein, partial [Cyclobacteriaceae bacterium]|nr:sterol desaturase family protein [Cyclobacteriaceae bacterium]
MEEFLDFFANMSALQKLAWIGICLLLAWILEAGIPLFRHEYKKIKHDGINLVFTLFTLILNVLVGLATVGLFYWVQESRVGVLHWVDWPIWAELLVAVLVLDFAAQYVVHWLLHRVKWMWKFHMVHHSDTHVDATTGTRHHPGDYLLREVFAISTVVLFGIPVSYYLFYRICTIFFTYLTHANIAVPVAVDKWLSLVFISPNMHKFHHHFERPWTDSNFGNIFS